MMYSAVHHAAMGNNSGHGITVRRRIVRRSMARLCTISGHIRTGYAQATGQTSGVNQYESLIKWPIMRYCI